MLSVFYRHTVSEIKLQLKRVPKEGNIGRIGVEYKVEKLTNETVRDNDIVPLNGNVFFENGQQTAVSTKKNYERFLTSLF